MRWIVKWIANLALPSPKLRWYLDRGQAIDVQMAAPLRAAARQLTLAAMQELNVAQLGGDSGVAEDTPDYQSCMELAQPTIANLAAGRRLLLIVPEESNIEKVRADFTEQCGQEPTVIRSLGGDLIACQEYERVEVRHAAAALIGNRPDFVEVAKRLHARVDVKWGEMPAEMKSPLDFQALKKGDLETAGGGAM